MKYISLKKAKNFGKKFAVAGTATLVAAPAAFAGDATASDGQQLTGITDVIFDLLEGSGGLLLALAGGAAAVYGIVVGNMRLVIGGVIGGIAAGVIAGIATNLHGATI